MGLDEKILRIRHKWNGLCLIFFRNCLLFGEFLLVYRVVQGERTVGHTARHIRDFKIDCYRGLRDLELQDLNEINILTGNNNSGKTSVLELISTLRSPLSISTWIKLCRMTRNGSYYTGVLNLFPADLNQMTIRFSCDADSKSISIGLNASTQTLYISQNDMDKINGLEHKADTATRGAYINAKRLRLGMKKNFGKIQEYDLYDFQTRVSVEESSEKIFPTEYVAPSAHVDGSILLDEVLESPVLYKDMMRILHEFDDSIMNITKSGNSAEYMVLSEKHDKAMPLSVYGDGMKKALVLLAAAVKAKDGILLLDEFETAIHTSAMNNIFAWILYSAQKLNVQVFLSSHSLEAIDKVLKCAPGLQDKINLYTLYNKEGRNLVRKMSCKEAIQAQDDWGVELR